MHTCPQICSYCYVENMERIYKAYSAKIEQNYQIALNKPDAFAAQLNSEYKKLRNSKSKKWKRLPKLPVRLYGSGDYIPGHYKFLSNLDFKFYIISKSLTTSLMESQLEKVLKLNNLTSIVLSFDKDNIKNYAYAKKYFNSDKIKFAYTGLPYEFEKLTDKFNIFFNISDKNIDKVYTRKFKEQCPCDSGIIKAQEACSICNKCWRSSLTKTNTWNV